MHVQSHRKFPSCTCEPAIFKLCFELEISHNFNMGPKLRARKADEPSEELQDIRKKMGILSKWLPGGEKAAATEEQEETEADPGDQPGESAPSQATEVAQSAGKK